MERVVSKHLFNYPLDGVMDPETAAYEKEMMEQLPEEWKDVADKSWEEFVGIARYSMNELDYKSHPSLVKANKDCIHTKFEVPIRDGNDFAVPVLVHTPKTLEGKKNRAAIIYAHGGGVVAGTAEMFQPLQSLMAVQSDIVIFNVEYRLAPETKCPKNALDFYCAVKHIAENASELGIDASKICINGDSGGGYIIAATEVMLAQKEESHLVKLAILGVPMLDDYSFGDLASMTKQEREDALTDRKCWEAMATDLEAQRKNADPLLFPAKVSDEILAKFPPTVVFEMEFDDFITQASRFACRLRAAGRLLELYVYPGAVHTSAWDVQLKIAGKIHEDYQLLFKTYLK